VGVLSGGQQQAVAIARAVLFDPKVLLLDEPTAALAAREVKEVLDLIRREKEQGRIVVLVSHRLNDVFEVADRIIVMKQGRLIADDSIKQTTLNQVVEKIVS
jgi:simple sugar transport system ATP-binding protein